MYQLSERSLNNLKGVHPNLVKVMKEAISNSPVDFTITEGVRTIQRQQELYALGRTKPGQKVTNADGIKNRSNHQTKSDGYGYAVDLYPFFLGKVQVNHPDTIKNLKRIADHIKEIANKLGVKIVWGGDWQKPYDPPHFQLA
ncbi:M15 family metallopeptidase [Bergeyella cardium]|uniref:M15 family peptidase n=1 Tax=Bergeyella cardium TaxID=1585976 RepID=A0A6P1QVX1_9FLAO|nr:M15 family metallopeptidase [Bergeyella cardium]QHN64834.1 M15 family peptidase [Bergeyella cardium]WHE34141.1 M15 family metallopeptidase [Bergeyella cardium]WHF60792.1 M15 family metallopeptidase [Bergeyella cardium]